MQITSNHTFRFPVPRARVWDALAEVADYPTWWPWLRQFEAGALDEGEVWRCTIRPPLPYVLRCTVELATVRAPALVVARLDGDIAGDARLDLTDAAPGTQARITSRLRAARLPARVLSRLAPPVARWGHDWVFSTAARQFERAALGPGRWDQPPGD
jgi:uncharacterized protein YndB with AHSA1/START domain